MIKRKRFVVDILSHDITVIIDDPQEWDFGGLGRANIMGQIVRINKHLPHDTKCSTILHELVHIIDGLTSSELSEQQTDAIAIGMYSLIKGNRELIEDMLK